MFSSKFKKKSKYPSDLKNKYLFYCKFKLDEEPTDRDIWDMLWHIKNGHQHSIPRNNYLYGTFMTFIEKAY